MVKTKELRKAAQNIYLVTERVVAKDISDMLIAASQTIEDLQDFAIWMTGCGYDFCQHDYFNQKRDELLTKGEEHETNQTEP